MNASENAAPDGGARQVRNRQIVLFSAIAAAALVAVAGWIAASGGKPSGPGVRIAAELSGPDTAQESWTRRSEARFGNLETDLREVRETNMRLAEDNRRLQEQLRLNAEDAKDVIDRLTAALGEAVELGNAAPPPGPATDAPDIPGMPDIPDMPEAPFTGGGVFVPSNGRPGSGAATSDPGGAAQAPLIQRFELEGPGFREPEGEDAKPLSVWLPAGSHAEAVVIAGVDASAGVVSQGDPRPVLLRIVGPAWTAAQDGTAQSIGIEGCTVTGAAYGDLSSEKVYVRLRTLTCAASERGAVIETEVAGFVAGAGKTGVRGPVVSREGALVEKAFFAGLVSGAGQGVSTAFAPQAVAANGGATVANTGLDDIGRAALGGGAATAGRQVSDYLIRRAEQYQPVIQLQAGTPVTVVFLEGTRLDGRPDTDPARRTNDNG